MGKIKAHRNTQDDLGRSVDIDISLGKEGAEIVIHKGEEVPELGLAGRTTRLVLSPREWNALYSATSVIADEIHDRGNVFPKEDLVV